MRSSIRSPRLLLARVAARFSPYRIVFYYFAKWQQEGVWERINHALRDQVRVAGGKNKPQAL
jgi:putative transposase